MLIESKLNHMQIAEEIYDYLKHEYKFLVHKHQNLNEAKTTLANKLLRLEDFEVKCWFKAIEGIGMQQSDNAPTPKEMIHAIKATAKEMAVVVNNHRGIDQVDHTIDYEALWKAADDKAKFTFFTDHKFSDVPSYVRYWFMKYNKKHRGFSAYESTMLIKYWALPFSHANEGAMINKQREIRHYFENRKNG